MTTCDFVPDPAIAAAIQATINLKELVLAEEINFAGFEKKFASLITLAEALRVDMDTQIGLVQVAIVRALQQAGCDIPPLPLPPVLDVSDCTQALADVSSQAAEGPLDFLAGVMTITLDENNLPTRITVP